MGRQQIGEAVLGGTSGACHLCRDVDFHVVPGMYYTHKQLEVANLSLIPGARATIEIFLRYMFMSHIIPLMTFAVPFLAICNAGAFGYMLMTYVTSSITRCIETNGVKYGAYAVEYHLLFNPPPSKLMYN